MTPGSSVYVDTITIKWSTGVMTPSPFPEVLVVTREQLPEDVRRQLELAVRSVLAGRAAHGGDEAAPRGGGWDVAAATALLSRLEREGRPIQAQAIREAARSGGRVSRARIYEIAGYSPGRSLKGWTRPIARLVEQMRATGSVAADAVVPLATEYDPRRTSYQQALGFVMPTSVTEVFALAAGS